MMIRPAVILAFALPTVCLGGTGESNNRAEALLGGTEYSQSEAAALILDDSLSRENFIGLVKKSGGEGKVMETLSLMASSPGVVESRFDELIEAASVFPDSEAAVYLASNQYLDDRQTRLVGEAVAKKPDSRMAASFVRSGGAGTDVLDKLANLVVNGRGGAVSEAVAGASGLGPDTQKKLLFFANQNPDSAVAAAFFRNPNLNDETKDSLGASVVKNPVGPLAENFSSNSGISPAQMAALAGVAVDLPDSGVAAGIGANRALQPSIFPTFKEAVASSPYSRLGVALAGNPNLPDVLFDELVRAVSGDKVGEMSAELAKDGGAACNEVRAAVLANLAITDPNLPICEVLVNNPAVPPAHLSGLCEEAANKPGSTLSNAFVSQIRAKKFRGSRQEKMKILEAALMSGDVQDISR